MKGILTLFLIGSVLPFVAFASNEGVPAYYQKVVAPNANQASYGQYEQQGYTKYVGKSGSKQVVGTETYVYDIPRPPAPENAGTMTANGIALPLESTHRASIYAKYGRRFADFEFETGVNSLLKWDNMIFNEVGVGGQYNFNVGKFGMFANAEYTYGRMESGGLSIDSDLKPFDYAFPTEGIFTVSIGDQSGRTNHFRFGLGAHHAWDIGGWKFSPSIGYEIFKHNLEMKDHLYPNPGVYLPLLTQSGDYVFADVDTGNYYPVPQGTSLADVPQNWYQVCMSPEDIKVVTNLVLPNGSLGNNLVTGDYDNNMGDIWGVAAGDCVIIGGDGPIKIPGTTHIYNTTWSGFYLGLEVEKQMTLRDNLRFYVQFGLPKYSSKGIWPNRDDWQQNPSFIDEGSNDSYSYDAELEYDMRLSNRLRLMLKLDTDYFHVGKIGGKLYVAETVDWKTDDNTGEIIGYEIIPAHTENVSNQLKYANWQSFGLQLGLKFLF